MILALLSSVTLFLLSLVVWLAHGKTSISFHNYTAYYFSICICVWTGFNTLWEEEICLENALHLYARLWCWFWPHGSCFFNIRSKVSWKTGMVCERTHSLELRILFITCQLISYCFELLQVGYIVTSCLLNENHDFLRLAINTVRNDIIGRNETFQCLALTLVQYWNFFSYKS